MPSGSGRSAPSSTAAGVGLAIWSRLHLGRQWSAGVVVRADHELIATGPYSRIRHPIYTEMPLGMLGTAVVVVSGAGCSGF